MFRMAWCFNCAVAVSIRCQALKEYEDFCSKVNLGTDEWAKTEAERVCACIDQTCFTVNLCRHFGLKQSGGKKTAPTAQPQLKTRVLHYTNKYTGGSPDSGLAKATNLLKPLKDLYDKAVKGDKL